MEPETFVQELAALAPSLSELKKGGFSSEDAENLVKSFICMKRTHALQKPSGSDDLLVLLRGWDLRNVEIGMIRFPDLPTELSGKISIGCVEGDSLVRLSDSGEIAVHECGTDAHLLWYAAKNGSSLLNALVIAAQFLEQRGAGIFAFDDYDAARSIAVECASAAGGDRYLDFYKMLLVAG